MILQKLFYTSVAFKMGFILIYQSKYNKNDCFARYYTCILKTEGYNTFHSVPSRVSCLTHFDDLAIKFFTI